MEKTQNSPLTCLLCARGALSPGRPAVECLHNLMFVPLFFPDPSPILTPPLSACSCVCARARASVPVRGFAASFALPPTVRRVRIILIVVCVASSPGVG